MALVGYRGKRRLIPRGQWAQEEGDGEQQQQSSKDAPSCDVTPRAIETRVGPVWEERR